MPPREVAIGVIVVSAQLLYSLVYPYAEQSLQSLPKLALEVEKFIDGMRFFGDANTMTSEGANVEKSLEPAPTFQHGRDGIWLGVASDSHRLHSGQQEGQRRKRGEKHASRKEVVQEAVARRMMPHMSSTIETFKENGHVDAASVSELEIMFDVHRITDAEAPFAYLFRVGLKNVSPHPCPLQGIARFYVLRAPDGQVFPIHRMTEGAASYTLNSGEEYKYSWVFFTRYKTAEAAGGILLENKKLESGGLKERFLNITLASVEPAKARGVTSEKAHVLMKNFIFMGALDLTEVSYL